MIHAIVIGDIEISSYWLMLTVGMIGMFVCANKRRALFSLTTLHCAIFTVLLTIVGVAGAMMLYAIESGAFGGVSFFGSVYLIPLLMPLIGMVFGLKPSQTMDICAPCVAIMIGCMRFSCFLTGCCGGWLMCVGDFCFKWPTQVIESILDFALLSFLLRRESQAKNIGQLYPVFLVFYSLFRFIIEFLRDTSKDWFYLSHGQWFSIAALLLGFVWIMWSNKTERFK